MTLSVVTQVAPEDSLETFGQMLKSVNFAHNITVYAMSMKGNNQLLQYAKEYALKLIHIKTPVVVEAIRAQQVRDAKGDWVLIMDFDEIVTPSLAREIRSVVSSPLTHACYELTRKNFSLGYPLSYGGWGTDYVPRLFHKKSFLDWPTDVHSTPTFTGSKNTLSSFLEHHKDPSLENIVNKTNRYTDKEATQYYDGGIAPVTSFTLLRKLHMEMIRRGLFKRGLLDGKIGLIQSIYQGFSVFISYAKLYERQNKKQIEQLEQLEQQISTKTTTSYNKIDSSNH